VSGQPGKYNGEMGFEIGVANGLCFDYLNKELFTKLIVHLKSKEPFHILDFLVIVCYYYFKNGKKISLNFDYFLLRFIIRNLDLIIHLFHIKGIRRMPLDEFLTYVIHRIRQKMKKNRIKTFRLIMFKTLG